MAEGVVKSFPAIIKPVVQFCLDHDINVIQMPCPETLCAAGGLGRVPHGKAWYEHHGLRETAREIAGQQARYMKELVSSGMNVLGIVGVEFSPACAVSYLNHGRSIVRGSGIYVEELKSALKEVQLVIPVIGVAQRWHKKMERDLRSLLSAMQASGGPINA
jgi:predicted secreted protein